MADDAPGPMQAGHWTTDPFAVIGVLLLVGALLNGIITSLEERFGIVIGDGGIQSAYEWKPLTEQTPMGTPVRTIGSTEVLDTPSDGVLLGRQPRGAEGEIVDGPVLLRGERWWKVDFLKDPDGWVKESDLREVNPRSLLTDLTPIGAPIATNFDDTKVFAQAGGGELLGTQPALAKGVILDGPHMVNGERWWRVDFEEGVDGWVSERDLSRVPRPHFLGMDIGDAVRTTLETPLFEEPFGTIGKFLREGVVGRIIGGPNDESGDRWWLLEFADGSSGWLPETVLERAEIGSTFSFFSSLKFWLTVFSILISAILLAAIGVVGYRLYQVRSDELLEIWSAAPKPQSEQRNPRWEHVLSEVVSDNPQSWRAAIIEADIMLDEMLTKMGYVGGGVGDKLKQIARGDFYTLDKAWEAHKVRNQIAHQGSDYIVTKREANRVIALYREVFEEFHYI